MFKYHCKTIKEYCDKNFKWGKDKNNLISLTQNHIDNYSKVCKCGEHQPERNKREDLSMVLSCGCIFIPGCEFKHSEIRCSEHCDNKHD